MKTRIKQLLSIILISIMVSQCCVSGIADEMISFGENSGSDISGDSLDLEYYGSENTLDVGEAVGEEPSFIEDLTVDQEEQNEDYEVFEDMTTEDDSDVEPDYIAFEEGSIDDAETGVMDDINEDLDNSSQIVTDEAVEDNSIATEEIAFDEVISEDNVNGADSAFEMTDGAANGEVVKTGVAGENANYEIKIADNKVYVRIFGNGSIIIGNAENGYDLPEVIKDLCKNGEDVYCYIEDGIDCIGIHFFLKWDTLKYVEIPSSVNIICGGAFYMCSNLETIVLHEGLKTIEDAVFGYCTKLENIKIPNSVDKIGDCAFLECPSLTSAVIPNGVTEVKDCTFYNCKSLRSVKFSRTVETIGSQAFFNCISLTDFKLPRSLKTMGWIPFLNVPASKILTVPPELKNYDLHDLPVSEVIYFYGDKPNMATYYILSIDKVQAFYPKDNDTWKNNELPDYGGKVTWTPWIPGDYSEKINEETEDSYWRIEGNTLYIEGIENVPEFTKDEDGDGKKDAPWYKELNSIDSCKIGDGVKSLCKNFLCGATKLKSVELPGSIELIGNNAFRECVCLNDINYTFANQAEFVSAFITIGDSAFQDCTALKNLDFLKKVKSIGTRAFYGCNSIESPIMLPSSVDTLGDEVFSSPLITGVYIPQFITKMSSEESLDKSAFSACKNLKTVVFEEGIKKIPDYALLCCENVEDVLIPEGVTEIGDCAFRSTKITYLDLPKSIETIGCNAFFSCKNLEKATINAKVIKEYAFGYCPNLEIAYIEIDVKTIEDQCFLGCDVTVFEIYGYRDSEAERYAKKYGYKFVCLDGGFDLKKDGYRFKNNYLSFGYPDDEYNLPYERYAEVFGYAFSKHIYNQYNTKYCGNCLGMAVTSIMFYLGILPMHKYIREKNVNGEYSHEHRIDFLTTYYCIEDNKELLKLIERYQIWQKSFDYDLEGKYIEADYREKNNSNAQYFMEWINRLLLNKEPVIININWYTKDKTRYGHSMVVNTIRNPEKINEDTWRLYLYDPNCPYRSDDDFFKTSSEDKYIDLNVSTGEWVVLASVNSDFADDRISNKESGQDALIYFEDISKYPTSFSNPANFTYNDDDGDLMYLFYRSEGFRIEDKDHNKVADWKNGVLTNYSNKGLTFFVPASSSVDKENQVTSGRLLLPKDEYTVVLENGYVAFSSEGNYAGIVVNEPTTIKNISSTSLEVVSESDTTSNVVIEETNGEEFTCISTDIETSDAPTVLSLDDGKVTINSTEQNIDLGIISSEHKDEIKQNGIFVTDNTIIDLDDIQVHEHIHNYGDWIITLQPTCGTTGIEERTCIECGEKETRTMDATGEHNWGKWKTIKNSTALGTGKKSRTCTHCNLVQYKKIPKLEPTYNVNTSSIVLKIGQNTDKVKITGLAKGDSIKKWSSKDKSVATVTKDGLIKGKGVGTTTITATLASGVKIPIKVKVQKKAVYTEKISGLPEELYIKKGKKKTLIPIITPITSSEKVNYKSSDKKIVTVSANGVVKGIRAGKAKITVSSGKRKFTIKVTVKK